MADCQTMGNFYTAFCAKSRSAGKEFSPREQLPIKECSPKRKRPGWLTRLAFFTFGERLGFEVPADIDTRLSPLHD
jgi:hypothetical protein